MYRILISADVPGWAYHRRAVALKKYAPDDFDVAVSYHSQAPTPAEATKAHDLGSYDLLFNLCYQTRGFDGKIVRDGLKTKLVISHNRDSKSKLERWDDSYNPVLNTDGFVICNNLEIFDVTGRLPRTCNISNGLDSDVWKVHSPMAWRPKRVIWCGGSNPRKGKRYFDILRPMEPILQDKGFETDFRAFHGGSIADWAYPTEKQQHWYNGSAVVVCASEAEGTPNFILEGMACGCVPVSVYVGNIREYGRDRENCVICVPTVESMIEGVEYAWDHYMGLSVEAVETMQGWTYGEPGNRAAYFYQLFRRLIDDGADSIEPFTFLEKSPEEI